MELSSLTIRNFRNLASVDVAIPSTGVVVIGDNGQGKTNLLEAIYYLVLFRSLRGAKDRELVRFGDAGFFVAGEATPRVTAGYEIHHRHKKVTVDGTEVKKLSSAVGVVVAVALSPADRALVEGGPSGRRRYLDVLLSLSDPHYLAALAELRAAMKQRNAALKRGNVPEAQAFDRPVAAAAATVAKTRHRWALEWLHRYGELCTSLGESSEPGMTYSSRHWTPDGGADLVAENLKLRIERDLRRGTTTVGPHRDDLLLTLGERETRRFGSAGQQRTAAIALRLLEASALSLSHDTAPIALFDDVFAELDEDRQERLLLMIKESLPGQAIITAPRDAEVPRVLFERPRWRMTGGKIEQ
ncbi:MAG: DNA replication and repair protein RecF [Gemmatimonadota bacterium]|nr:MAG: DNA replication and repair protein RecF [Gemmatimonadota bacterium]